MKTSTWVIMGLSLIAGSTSAQAQVEKVAKAKAKGTFVTTVGTHTLNEGRLTFKIEEVNGKLDSHVTRNRVEGDTREPEGWGPLNPRIKTDASWFIYADSPDEVWWFDGDSHLYMMIFGDHRPRFARGGIYQMGQNNLQMAPQEVQDRLPKAFKKGSEKEEDKSSCRFISDLR